MSTPRHASLYLPFECEIVSVTDLTPGEKLFRVRRTDGAPLGHLPGQFVQVSLLGWGEAPISVASSPTRNGIFELGVRRAGALTGAMHRIDSPATPSASAAPSAALLTCRDCKVRICC